LDYPNIISGTTIRILGRFNTGFSTGASIENWGDGTSEIINNDSALVHTY
jgi:hypothetical protein